MEQTYRAVVMAVKIGVLTVFCAIGKFIEQAKCVEALSQERWRFPLTTKEKPTSLSWVKISSVLDMCGAISIWALARGALSFAGRFKSGGLKGRSLIICGFLQAEIAPPPLVNHPPPLSPLLPVGIPLHPSPLPFD